MGSRSSRGHPRAAPCFAIDHPHTPWFPANGTPIDYGIGPNLAPGWTEAMRRAGVPARTRVVRIRTQRVPPRLRPDLDVVMAARVHVLSRMRFLEDDPVGCSVSYVVASVAPSLPARVALEGSLTRILRDAYALAPVPAWAEVEVAVPPDDVPRRLGLRQRPRLLRVRTRIDSERLGRPIAVSVTWLRPDRFRVMMGFDLTRDGRGPAAGGSAHRPVHPPASG